MIRSMFVCDQTIFRKQIIVLLVNWNIELEIAKISLKDATNDIRWCMQGHTKVIQLIWTVSLVRFHLPTMSVFC